MIPKSILILAAGEQERWGDDPTPKQLLYAGPETILDRIVRQCRDHGYDPIIITHKSILARDQVTFVVPASRRWKVESILDIHNHWGSNSTLILLGDVIYQNHVMNRIFNYSGPDMFFGNYAEIFAYYFNRRSAQKYLEVVLDRCLRYDDKGTLHSLFRAYIDNFTSRQLERKKDASRNFTHVTGDGGWTRDIDEPDDYTRFLDQVVRPKKLDDLPRSNR